MSLPSNEGFSLVDYLAQLNLSPTTGIEVPTTAPVKEEGEVTISKSDQEIERDIAALMLPPPSLSTPAFQAIVSDIQQYFSINNIAATGGGSKAFGATETGITLASVFAWAQVQNPESALVQSLLGGVQPNPLQVALSQYVSQNQGKITPIDAQSLQLVLRQMPVLSAVIHTVDPNLVRAAFLLAEGQMVSSMLDKWNQAIQDSTEAEKEDAVQQDIKNQDIKEQNLKFQQTSMEIMRSYLAQILANQQTLSSPVVSTIIGSLLTNATSIEAASGASPFISGVTGIGESIQLLGGTPASVLALLNVLSLGVVSAATTWATPVSMALSKSTRSLSPEQANYDAAKAYAVSLSAFLMNPSFESFFSAQLERALESGAIKKK